uniref:Uncharacterized protein n=1 Tax=Romanomermis culicivorax TaxID=13658 RepID=A0A915JWR3_ROMCU
MAIDPDLVDWRDRQSCLLQQHLGSLSIPFSPRKRSHLVVPLEEHTFLWRKLAKESWSPICCAEGGNVVFKNFHCVLKNRKIL